MFSLCLPVYWEGEGVPQSLVPGPFPVSGPRSFPGRGYPSQVPGQGTPPPGQDQDGRGEGEEGRGYPIRS